MRHPVAVRAEARASVRGVRRWLRAPLSFRSPWPSWRSPLAPGRRARRAIPSLPSPAEATATSDGVGGGADVDPVNAGPGRQRPHRGRDRFAMRHRASSRGRAAAASSGPVRGDASPDDRRPADPVASLGRRQERHQAAGPARRSTQSGRRSPGSGPTSMSRSPACRGPRLQRAEARREQADATVAWVATTAAGSLCPGRRLRGRGGRLPFSPGVTSRTRSRTSRRPGARQAHHRPDRHVTVGDRPAVPSGEAKRWTRSSATRRSRRGSPGTGARVGIRRRSRWVD